MNTQHTSPETPLSGRDLYLRRRTRQRAFREKLARMRRWEEARRMKERGLWSWFLDFRPLAPWSA